MIFFKNYANKFIKSNKKSKGFSKPISIREKNVKQKEKGITF